MAFKQVRNRAQLFRPWAFGDPDPLRQQKGGDIQANTPISSIDLDSKSVPQSTHGHKNDQKILPEANPSLYHSISIPSAFRSTSLFSRTMAPLTEHLPVLGPASFLSVPDILNTDLHHPLPLPTREDVIMPDANLCPYDIVHEVPYPVNPHISQVLDQESIPKWRVKKKQRAKKFRCGYCDVSFSNNGQLKGHIRIHTGERPFACDHQGCNKNFTRNEELTRHKRIHTGVRPHGCLLCGKSFGRKDHLKKHVKTHSRTNVVRMQIGAFQGLSYFVSDCIPWF